MAIALLLTVTTARSQTETDTSFRFQMNTIFGPLDKSKVPYGILRDYAMEFVNLEYFNGTTPLADSNYCHRSSYWLVYNTILSGRIHSNATGLLRSDTLAKRWYNSFDTGRITLSGLYFLYSRFKDNASPSFITITSNKLYDKYISGVWQNPYVQEKVFVISPPDYTYPKTSFKLLLPATLWLSNSTYTGLSINVSDGLGYRTLTPGIPLVVSYSTSGLKEWTYRIQSGGSYLYAHSLIMVGSVPPTSL